jgi:hypothetical protein
MVDFNKYLLHPRNTEGWTAVDWLGHGLRLAWSWWFKNVKLEEES